MGNIKNRIQNCINFKWNAKHLYGGRHVNEQSGAEEEIPNG